MWRKNKIALFGLPEKMIEKLSNIRWLLALQIFIYSCYGSSFSVFFFFFALFASDCDQSALLCANLHPAAFSTVTTVIKYPWSVIHIHCVVCISWELMKLDVRQLVLIGFVMKKSTRFFGYIYLWDHRKHTACKSYIFFAQKQVEKEKTSPFPEAVLDKGRLLKCT